MQDAQRELEHLSKLATADRTKRFGKLYRLVRQIPLLTIAGKTGATKHWRKYGWNRWSNAAGYRPDMLSQWLELAQNQYHPQAVRRAYIPKVKRDGVRLAFRPFGTECKPPWRKFSKRFTNLCFVTARMDFDRGATQFTHVANYHKAGALDHRGDLVKCFDSIPHGSFSTAYANSKTNGLST